MTPAELLQLKGYDLDHLAVRFHKNLVPAAREYLQTRGLADEIIDELRLGIARGPKIGFGPQDETDELDTFFEGYVILPIRNSQGQVKDLIGLPIDPEEEQYISLSGDIDYLFVPRDVSGSDHLFLCESPFDAMAILQAGLNAVSVFGSSNMSDRWIPVFTRKQIFVCFHSGLSSQKNTYRAMDLIAPVAEDVFHLELPRGIHSVSQLFVSVENPVEVFTALVNQSRREGRYRRFSPDSLRQATYVEEFLRRKSGRLGGLATGLQSLDALLLGGLREGFYVVAGYPGSGKTTFMRQVAENIAASDHPVLYYSLEMSAFELWSRAIARLSGRPMGQILSGKAPKKLVEKASVQYEKIAQNIWTIEGSGTITLSSVAGHIRQAYNQLGKVPLVAIDYLERIPVEIPSGLDGARLNSMINPNMLNGMRAAALKQLSMGFGCPVLVASSLDQNPSLSWDAFADKGELQHTADVIFMMRLPVLPGQWEEFRTEWAQDPGEITLELLKNRNGSTGEIPLVFYKGQGRFEEKKQGPG